MSDDIYQDLDRARACIADVGIDPERIYTNGERLVIDDVFSLPRRDYDLIWKAFGLVGRDNRP